MSANGRGASPPAPWISFEGIEGVGKTTQIELLARRMERAGCTVLTTREPGGTSLGRRLRQLLLQPSERPMHPLAELMLYAADRAQHLVEVVLPARERGELVLCDRFLDATLAYQGHARGLGFEAVLELHRCPPLDARPDRTVLLDMDPRSALSRARQRNEESGQGASEGRFEDERIEFHEKVREGYLLLARREPERVRVVEAEGRPDRVAERVTATVRDLIPGLEESV